MKFYKNDSLIEVRSNLHFNGTSSSDAEVIQNPSFERFFEVYNSIEIDDSNTRNYFFVVADYESFVAKINSGFKKVRAAGGIVEKDSSVLVIKRLGKLDLPKGKMEKGEEVTTAAKREVLEEGGVKASVISKLCTSFHSYSLNGKDYLKDTHWFCMKCNDDSHIKPQLEESIEDVFWVERDQVKNLVYPNTYATIRDVFDTYFHQ